MREIVYIIGAGFSKGCGFPLTSELLVKVWPRIEKSERVNLQRIIKFHHPNFQSKVPSSFPNIEKLLTEITVNIDLFESSRHYPGNFEEKELINARLLLLSTIATWFHEIYNESNRPDWLNKFVSKVKNEEAGIITFNWDLLLDQLLFGSDITGLEYGLRKQLPAKGPIILKPHGSLNWYEAEEIKLVKEDKRRVLFKSKSIANQVEAFILPREIRSSNNKKYTPLIVAPTYLKDFSKPIFQHLWKQSTELISTAKEIVFIGYSLPDDDMQARYILRCGFHNQIEGIIRKDGRAKPTGNAQIKVINPDEGAVNRIKEIANLDTNIIRPANTVEEWMG